MGSMVLMETLEILGTMDIVALPIQVPLVRREFAEAILMVETQRVEGQVVQAGMVYQVIALQAEVEVVILIYLLIPLVTITIFPLRAAMEVMEGKEGKEGKEDKEGTAGPGDRGLIVPVTKAALVMEEQEHLVVMEAAEEVGTM